MEVTAIKNYGEAKQLSDKSKPSDDIFSELLAALFANVKTLSMQNITDIKAGESTGNVKSTGGTSDNNSLLNNLITVINQLKLNSKDSDLTKLFNMLNGKTGIEGTAANSSSIEKFINVLENEKTNQASKNNTVNGSSSLSNLEKLIAILQDKDPGQNKQILDTLLSENNASVNINSDKVMAEVQNIINEDSTGTNNSKEINSKNITEVIQKIIDENSTGTNNSKKIDGKNITELIQKIIDESSSIKDKDNSIKTTAKANSIKSNKEQIISDETTLTGEKNKELSKVNKTQSLITDIKKNDDDFNNKVQTNITSAAVKKELTEIKTPEQSAVISKNSDIVEVAVEKFKSLRLPDITELKVRLQPKELGEITVKLVLEKGQINGNIIATKKETAEILQNHFITLKQNLEDNNIQLNNLSINLKSDDNFNGRHSNQSQSDDNRKNNKEIFKTFEDTINEVSDNNINLIA